MPLEKKDESGTQESRKKGATFLLSCFPDSIRSSGNEFWQTT
jgi:hypothetical protein